MDDGDNENLFVEYFEDDCIRERFQQGATVRFTGRQRFQLRKAERLRINRAKCLGEIVQIAIA